MLICIGSTKAAVTNLYSTGFEKNESYDARYELAGQKGWFRYPDSDGGNGIITNFYGSWAGYVGLFSLQPAADFMSVWQPINFTAPTNNDYQVRFTVVMAVFDSTTTNRDDFYWSVYNRDGTRLFTLDFDNKDLGIYYLLDDNAWVDTGWSFENDVAYDLEIIMNFASNRWSAVLGWVEIVANERITTTNAARNLGDVDAVWAIAVRNRPGDNFMVFDDYRVRGELLPRLQPVGRQPNGQFTLRVRGLNGARYAVEGSTNLANWTPLRTNTIANGFFDFTDIGSSPLDRRVYRARWVP
jgi:hypothetical protein